jgi:hypothetical protein
MISVLIFPSGSLVAQEIYDSLKFEKDIVVYGTDYDTNNLSAFYFENYIPGCPNIDNKDKTLSFLRNVVETHSIKYIYPAFDRVLEFLKDNEEHIGASVLLPSIESIRICNSKLITYNRFMDILPTPIIYAKEDVQNYPVYVKPIIGYGSRDHKVAMNYDDIKNIDPSKYLILENLTGDEFTVDCFTNVNGKVFANSRKRIRTVNGMAISSKSCELKDSNDFAAQISKNLHMRGAWFFQVKYDSDNTLKLLEIACRVPGSMCTTRMNGINYPHLTILDREGYIIDDVLYKNIEVQSFKIYKNYYRTNIPNFEEVYCDLDDTLIIRNKINTVLVEILYSFINQKKKITVITRNANAKEYMNSFKLNFYDELIYVPWEHKKSQYIKNKSCIFIDDSYSERKDVNSAIGCSTFSLSDIELFNLNNIV